VAHKVTLNWTQNDEDVTHHVLQAATNGAGYMSLASVDMPTVTYEHLVSLGSIQDFKIIAYSGLNPGGSLEITDVLIPTHVEHFAESMVIPIWIQEADTASHYATGGTAASVTYTINLETELAGWSDSLPVNIYTKFTNATGTESDLTKIVIEEA